MTPNTTPDLPAFPIGHLASGGPLQAPRDHNARSAQRAMNSAKAFKRVSSPTLNWVSDVSAK